MYKKSKSCKHRHTKLTPEQAFDVCDYFTEDLNVQTGKFTAYYSIHRMLYIGKDLLFN